MKDPHDSGSPDQNRHGGWLSRMAARIEGVYSSKQLPERSDSASQDAAKAAADRLRKFMRDIELMVADNKGAAAAKLLREHLESEPQSSPSLHQRYRRLLVQLGDAESLAEHTHDWAARLLGSQQDREAVLATREMLQLDPRFRLRDADTRLRVCRIALSSAMTEVAVAQTSDFHLAHPTHPAVPEIALSGARLQIEKNADTATARAMLDFAATQFPDDPRVQEILLKIEQIDALAARISPASRR